MVKRLVAMLAVAALMASLLAQPVLAGRVHRLTYRLYCLAPDGAYGVLVIGRGTVNQPIDWAANPSFVPLGNSDPLIDNHLEGDSGALGFNTATYPDGVWVRWSDHPSVVTHIPVPRRLC